MSNNQQPNVWQTAARNRNANSASRTPQNRSGTASPSQSAPPSQPPKQEPARPQQAANAAPIANAAGGSTGNVWAQRGSNANSSNGTRADATAQEQQPHTPVNNFNASEVKAFLSRDAPPAYRPAEAPGARGAAAGGGGGAWASKPPMIMANGKNFLNELAKQMAAMEGGGG